VRYAWVPACAGMTLEAVSDFFTSSKAGTQAVHARFRVVRLGARFPGMTKVSQDFGPLVSGGQPQQRTALGP